MTKFAVKVVPRASRSEVVSFEKGVLKVRLAGAPVRGAANAELVSFLSKELGVPEKSISIIAGTRSRNKLVLIRSLEESGLKTLARACKKRKGKKPAR